MTDIYEGTVGAVTVRIDRIGCLGAANRAKVASRGRLRPVDAFAASAADGRPLL